MWKKSEPEVTPLPPAPKRPQPVRPEATTPRKARIGAGLSLKGDLYGEEDVIIEGRVVGTITLKGHGVIIEESGRVDAEVRATTICVAGEVRGNLHGLEQVVLLKTGRVVGDIFAKSVTLETGAQFKGSIDMEGLGAPKTIAATSLGAKASEKPSDDKTNDDKTNGAAARTAVS